MNVYQIRLKIFLMKDLPVEQAQTQLTNFIDQGLAKNEKFIEFHRENKYKNYCYDLLYPQEADMIYRSGRIYTLTIRTIDVELAKYFSESCVNDYTDYIKGLTAEIRIIPKRHIEMLYTLTPVILKDDKGYWKDHMAFEEFEERLKVNLIKKWNQFENVKLDEDFDLYMLIEVLNKGPIAVRYKEIKLLGDKLCLHIEDNATAQKLAYMSLGTGLLEMNSRGWGFVNYKWV